MTTDTHINTSDTDSYLNKGVHDTCFIHWLSFTIPASVDLSYVFSALLKVPKGAFVKQDKGRDGYYSCYNNEDNTILVMTDGGHDYMGHHVRITGTACEAFQDRLKEIGQKVLACQGHIARIDLAVDDLGGLLDLNEIEESVKNGLFTSKFRSSPTVMSKHEPATGKETGKTIAFGQRTSGMYIRIYDKAAQQKEDHHWVRCELEAKKANANAIMRKIAEGVSIGEVAFGLFKSYLTFRVEGRDSNHARWPVAPWWEDFLGNARKLKLGIRRDPPGAKLDWFINGHAGTLAKVVDRHGPGVLVDMYKRGKQKNRMKNFREDAAA